MNTHFKSYTKQIILNGTETDLKYFLFIFRKFISPSELLQLWKDMYIIIYI